MTLLCAYKEQIELVQKSLQRFTTGIHHDDVEAALESPFAEGDPEKASKLCELWEKSVHGQIEPYIPRIKLRGAINRNNVTCYIDSLLFGMFGLSQHFEALLYQEFDRDKPQYKLSVMLRLWVNMLRSGQIITTDIVGIL